MLPLLLALALAADTPPVQVDLHLDTLTQLQRRGVGFDADGLEAGLAQLDAGGTNVAIEALWPPRNVDHRAHTFALLDVFEAQVARHDRLELARTPTQARAIVARGNIALVLALEGAHGLGEAWQATLAQLYARGLRMLGLTWSLSNRFAGSSSDDGGGLTDEGRALLAMARDLGLVVDVSHASRETTLQVCQGSPVPVVASHSDAHALSPQPRNLTDEEIRCIAATGGVIGLNFHGPFVGENANVERLADQADHVARVGGFGAVAIGTDFDGIIQPPGDLRDAGHLPALWDALVARGWTPSQLAGIRGENFMRAWAAVQEYR